MKTVGDTFATYIVNLVPVDVPVPGDLDGDGDVDLDDSAILLNCMGGPIGEVWAGCEDTDLNDSGATDLADFATLQSAFGMAP